jgi:hypothetical protein
MIVRWQSEDYDPAPEMMDPERCPLTLSPSSFLLDRTLYDCILLPVWCALGHAIVHAKYRGHLPRARNGGCHI